MKNTIVAVFFSSALSGMAMADALTFGRADILPSLVNGQSVYVLGQNNFDTSDTDVPFSNPVATVKSGLMNLGWLMSSAAQKPTNTFTPTSSGTEANGANTGMTLEVRFSNFSCTAYSGLGSTDFSVDYSLSDDTGAVSGCNPALNWWVTDDAAGNNTWLAFGNESSASGNINSNISYTGNLYIHAKLGSCDTAFNNKASQISPPRYTEFNVDAFWATCTTVAVDQLP